MDPKGNLAESPAVLAKLRADALAAEQAKKPKKDKEKDKVATAPQDEAPIEDQPTEPIPIAELPKTKAKTTKKAK